MKGRAKSDPPVIFMGELPAGHLCTPPLLYPASPGLDTEETAMIGNIPDLGKKAGPSGDQHAKGAFDLERGLGARIFFSGFVSFSNVTKLFIIK